MTAHLDPKSIRPFNADHARAGAPYATRGGLDATVLKWDSRTVGYPLIGFYGPRDTGAHWAENGSFHDIKEEDEYDLVMTPLGQVQGKPFFVGDTIIGALGAPFTAEPRDKDGGLERWSWPAPAPVYPETQMSGADLQAVYVKHKGGVDSGMVAVANAAMRHAIDSGQVAVAPPKKSSLEMILEAKKCVVEPGQFDADRAARDMVVAKAVRDWYSDRFPGVRGVMADKFLADIISRVKS